MAMYNGKSTAQMTKSEVVAIMEELHNKCIDQNVELNKLSKELAETKQQLVEKDSAMQRLRHAILTPVMQALTSDTKCMQTLSEQIMHCIKGDIDNLIDNAIDEHCSEYRHDFTDPYR